MGDKELSPKVLHSRPLIERHQQSLGSELNILVNCFTFVALSISGNDSIIQLHIFYLFLKKKVFIFYFMYMSDCASYPQRPEQGIRSLVFEVSSSKPHVDAGN